MKRKILLGLVLSCATFGIGFYIVPKIRVTPLESVQPDSDASIANAEVTTPSLPPTSTPAPTFIDFVPEFTALPENPEYPESGNLIDIFNFGNRYWDEDEVIAKSGERWLTLFEHDGKYSLAWAVAKVQRKKIRSQNDESYLRLSFDNPGTPIFATKGLKALKPGPVTTLYQRPSDKEIDRRNLPIQPLQMGYSQDFTLQKRSNISNWQKDSYTLRVSRGLSIGGTELSVLVLEHGTAKQVIAENGYYGDLSYMGNLYWVGDLDGDGNLDLYLDGFGESEGFGGILFLSSQAKQGELVKMVAIFGAGGC